MPVFSLVFAPALGELYLTLARDKALSCELDPFGPALPLEVAREICTVAISGFLACKSA